MKFNLCDVYDSQPGDVLLLDEPADMIYAELLGNLKLGVITPKPNGQNIVNIVSTINASDFAKLLVGANFCDQDRMVLEIPENINQSTLRTVVYNLMKANCVFYKISVSMGYIIATKKAPTATSNKKVATAMLKRLTSGLTTSEKTNVESFHNLGSFMQAVRREADKMMVKVQIKRIGSVVEVTLGQEKYNDEDVGVYSKKFNSWLDSIPFDIPIDIPGLLIDDVSIGYIRVLLHNSKYDTKLSRGTVTKMKACLRKSGDSVFLRANGKTIHQFTGVASKNSLNADQIKLVDMLLLPYGIKHKDLL